MTKQENTAERRALAWMWARWRHEGRFAVWRARRRAVKAVQEAYPLADALAIVQWMWQGQRGTRIADAVNRAALFGRIQDA